MILPLSERRIKPDEETQPFLLFLSDFGAVMGSIMVLGSMMLAMPFSRVAEARGSFTDVTDASLPSLDCIDRPLSRRIPVGDTPRGPCAR